MSDWGMSKAWITSMAKRICIGLQGRLFRRQCIATDDFDHSFHDAWVDIHQEMCRVDEHVFQFHCGDIFTTLQVGEIWIIAILKIPAYAP